MHYKPTGVCSQNIEFDIDRVERIRCGFKATSCPDQLAQALKTAIGK